jgi:hypothetical protein
MPIAFALAGALRVPPSASPAAALPVEGDAQSPSLPSGDEPSGQKGSPLTTIGYSVEGRPIEVLRYDQGPRARWIVAGIHRRLRGQCDRPRPRTGRPSWPLPRDGPPSLTLCILPLLRPDGTARATGPASEPDSMRLIPFIPAAKIEALIGYPRAALDISPGGQPPESRSLSLAEALAEVSGYPCPPAARSPDS